MKTKNKKKPEKLMSNSLALKMLAGLAGLCILRKLDQYNYLETIVKAKLK